MRNSAAEADCKKRSPLPSLEKSSSFFLSFGSVYFYFNHKLSACIAKITA